MEYQTCGQNVSCSDLGLVRDCRNSTCDSGCFCSNGTVLEDGVCVDPDSCSSKTVIYIILCDQILASTINLVLVITQKEFFKYSYIYGLSHL